MCEPIPTLRGSVPNGDIEFGGVSEFEDFHALRTRVVRIYGVGRHKKTVAFSKHLRA
jgi:hypothetical protein